MREGQGNVDPTWRERLRYAVDEFFSRGTIALILGLFVVSTLIILVIAFVVALLGADDGRPFPQLLWMSLMRTLDPGTMGGDEGSATFLGAMLLVTLTGVFVLSALIGIPDRHRDIRGRGPAEPGGCQRHRWR